MRAFLNSLYCRTPRLAKLSAIACRLQLAAPRIRVRVLNETASSLNSERVRFERTGGQLSLFLSPDLIDQSSYSLNSLWKRLPIMVRVLSRTSSEVRQGWANLSDGQSVQGRDLAFSSNQESALLVPDRTFMIPRYYHSFRKVAGRGAANWNARTDTVLWRGGANGPGQLTNTTMLHTDVDLKHRVRVCLALRGVAGTDVRLTGIATDSYATRNRNATPLRCRSHLNDLAGERIPPIHWSNVKFALDVDGFTNAWSNLYSRLLMGCCVIKIASPEGYKQWYYDDLQPWIHYVPVDSDLVDLQSRIEWCRSHDQEAFKISQAGQRFAMLRTPESETLTVVQRINQALSLPH